MDNFERKKGKKGLFNGYLCTNVTKYLCIFFCSEHSKVFFYFEKKKLASAKNSFFFYVLPYFNLFLLINDFTS